MIVNSFAAIRPLNGLAVRAVTFAITIPLLRTIRSLECWTIITMLLPVLVRGFPAEGKARRAA